MPADIALALQTLRHRREQLRQALAFHQHELDQERRRVEGKRELMAATAAELSSIEALLAIMGEGYNG